MKFGLAPIGENEGAIVAHTVRTRDFVLKKGERLRAEHIAGLRAAGFEEIALARLEKGDVGEDEAALKLAQRAAGPQIRVETPFTGRSNLFSRTDGVLLLDPAAIDRVNGVDESVTVATLPPFRTVTEGEMVGTVKIIPFAVPGDVFARALTAFERPLLEVRPFSPLKLGVVSTLLPGLKPSVVDKTLRALEARLAPARATVGAHDRVPHQTAELAAAIRRLSPNCDLLIVFGASAITDRRDVIPSAVLEAGGAIERLGMPVDPGNLLLLGRTAEGRPLLGAPGCARSPKENGFDWVLHRILAGVPVGPADVRAMGAGGLLMEIVSRPQPRGGAQPDVESHAERLDADG